MYIRKDIHKSLRLEAKMAEGSHCHSWSKLFLECSYLLKKKDKEIGRLRVENIQMQAALGYGICAEDERHIIPSNPYKCGVCDARVNLYKEPSDD